MGVAHERGFGPYTVYDLDALPDEGKSYELADGWLIPLSPSPRHDMAAEAARASAAKVHIQGPLDISTPAGIRKPDVGVMDRDSARDAGPQPMHAWALPRASGASASRVLLHRSS
ncbi:hypothetical protein [Nocardia sp. NPDC046763]|uniref:hypothetical protein n=1 Tax=Nocardia sp. NPDC046763 TaxID=3155256 RepID=UPI0033C23E05